MVPIMLFPNLARLYLLHSLKWLYTYKVFGFVTARQQYSLFPSLTCIDSVKNLIFSIENRTSAHISLCSENPYPFGYIHDNNGVISGALKLGMLQSSDMYDVTNTVKNPQANTFVNSYIML